MHARPVAERARTRPGLGAFLRASLWLGCTAFGGGLAILVQAGDLLERRGWLSRSEWARAATVAQLLPGGAATNALAFAALRLFGGPQALLAVAVYVAPSSLALALAAAGWAAAGRGPWMEAALAGSGAAVVGLVAAAALRLGRSSLRRPWQLLLLALVLLLERRLGVSVPVVIALGVAAGLLAGPIDQRLRERRRRLAFRRPPEPKARGVASPGLLLTLFLAFAHIGAVAYGGGFAVVPLIARVAVTEHGWLLRAELNDAIALGQVTPGPVLVCASFIGARAGGPLGALSATVGVFLVPALLMVAGGSLLERYRRDRRVRAALRGLLPAVVGMMLAAALELAASGVHDLPGALLVALSLGGVLLLRWNAAGVVVGAALVRLLGTALLAWG